MHAPGVAEVDVGACGMVVVAAEAQRCGTAAEAVQNLAQARQEVRADASLDGVRILMLTAKGRENDVSKGLALGADGYMIKPFSTRELVEKVRKLIGAAN